MYLTGTQKWGTEVHYHGLTLDQIPKSMCLKLSPYDSRGNYKEKLLPISHDEIEPAYVICPTSFICGTLECQPRCLIQST